MRDDCALLSLEVLTELRERANREALTFIRRQIAARQASDGTPPPMDTSTGSSSSSLNAPSFPIMPVQSYACLLTRKYHHLQDTQKDVMIVEENGDSVVNNAKEYEIEFLNPTDEMALIRFYSSKIFSLIGPNAQMSRLQKDAKVASTAAILFRRFFLSNSVMMYDPKAIMVAAVFLASKAEDATIDIRWLEEGTQAMNAPVSISEIINAEIQLIEGVNFELLYFHPYNSVMAFTEDLRSFLKSDLGSTLVSFPATEEDPYPNRVLSGEDLRPMHDEARRIIDDAVVSDVPLMASPGQMGLAALIVANESLIQGKQSQGLIPRIKFHEYIKHRFSNDHKDHDVNRFLVQIDHVCAMLRELKEGKYGCGNHEEDLEELKKIHKKLKACRAWGGGPSMKSGKNKKRKRDEPRE